MRRENWIGGIPLLIIVVGLLFYGAVVYNVGMALSTRPVCDCHGICDAQFKCGLKECPK